MICPRVRSEDKVPQTAKFKKNQKESRKPAYETQWTDTIIVKNIIYQLLYTVKTSGHKQTKV